jgi:hypothetical protein
LKAASLIKQFGVIFGVWMKKRRIKWPYGNPSFVAYEGAAAAGLLLARRNPARVSAGTRLCQGGDLWRAGKFAGALRSCTRQDLATLPREELWWAPRAACGGRHREFQPEQPRLPRARGGARPNAGRRPKGGVKRLKLSLTLTRLTWDLIAARRGALTRGAYLDSLFTPAPPPLT